MTKNKRMSRKWWIIIAAIVLVVVVACIVFAVRQASVVRRMTQTSLGAETAVVQRGTLLITVNASGNLAPQDEVSLAFTSGGRVAEVFVAEGQQVTAGDPLARLDTADLESQVAQAEIALRQAELAQETLLQPPSDADVERARDAVAEAAASYNVAQLDLDSVLSSTLLNQSLEDAQSALDDAQARYQDYAARYARGEVSYWYVEHFQQIYEDKQDALTSVQQQGDSQLTGAQNSLSSASHAYNQAQNTLNDLLDGAGASDCESAQLKVDQAQASLGQAQRNLEQATLIATMSGVVTALNVRAGETAGSPAVVVSDLTQLEVSINLDEADVAQVAVGQRARIILDAFPDAELTGEVVTVAPVATVTSGVVLYPVTVQLAPTTQPVRSGMTADVEVVLNSRENALIIPLRAVQSMDDGDFVLRQAGGAGTPGSGRPGPRGGAVGFELVPVTLGLMNDSDVEVTSGLSEGDVVSVTALPTQGGQGGFGPVGMFGGGDN